ncbi:MAG TPA: FAD-dependent oxidoreductase [Actinomycetota bacterium]|nr:FAD-dependent oxidoreductase [Actinomycetota bacterium]
MAGRLEDACEVAVIGAGAIGLSVAGHLEKAGVHDIVVFEAEAAPGHGSSSRANGGFRAQFTTAINIEFSRYSIAEFERFDERSGGVMGFHQTGYLLFTADAEREAALRAASELQRSLGVDTEWLTPDDIVARAPLVRREGLRAGSFHARDGFLDPHGLVSALRRDARRADLRTNRPVVAIEEIDDGFEITTPVETTKTRWVVNAAGAHARAIGAMLGIEIPVDPVRRNLAFVPEESAGPLIPMCVDLDTGVLVRREVHGGYVIAYSNPNDAAGWETSVDPRFLDDVAERIGNRFPSLEGIPIDPRHCWAGLYPETVDHHAVVGAAPGHPRFIICGGFGGHGLMHSPAAGRAVAELIVHGECTTFDLHPLRPARFAENDLVVETAVL